MSSEQTREAQYQVLLDIREREGMARFGLMTNQVWRDDPKRLLFVLSRYKFAAKMLRGRRKVLEVGCADAFGTRLVRQEVESVVAVDFDPVFIADAESRANGHWPVEYRVHDMLAGPVDGSFDGAFTLDVLEHIEARDEDRFIANIARSLTPHGVLIVGSPSIQSQAYASPQSKEGHVNCKDERGVRGLMERHFENVFVLSMNDEVVHTGFPAMAHYLVALCCSKKTTSTE
jgi:2-polyprenyl-3-methyl-5-hydroxy-6-metoxy-1,4-benzoquinol methylase